MPPQDRSQDRYQVPDESAVKPPVMFDNFVSGMSAPPAVASAEPAPAAVADPEVLRVVVNQAPHDSPEGFPLTIAIRSVQEAPAQRRARWRLESQAGNLAGYLPAFQPALAQDETQSSAVGRNRVFINYLHLGQVGGNSYIVAAEKSNNWSRGGKTRTKRVETWRQLKVFYSALPKYQGLAQGLMPQIQQTFAHAFIEITAEEIPAELLSGAGFNWKQHQNAAGSAEQAPGVPDNTVSVTIFFLENHIEPELTKPIVAPFDLASGAARPVKRPAVNGNYFISRNISVTTVCPALDSSSSAAGSKNELRRDWPIPLPSGQDVWTWQLQDDGQIRLDIPPEHLSALLKQEGLSGMTLKADVEVTTHYAAMASGKNIAVCVDQLSKLFGGHAEAAIKNSLIHEIIHTIGGVSKRSPTYYGDDHGGVARGDFGHCHVGAILKSASSADLSRSHAKIRTARDADYIPDPDVAGPERCLMYHQAVPGYLEHANLCEQCIRDLRQLDMSHAAWTRK